jgi:hypothetical protein
MHIIVVVVCVCVSMLIRLRPNRYYNHLFQVLLAMSIAKGWVGGVGG